MDELRLEFSPVRLAGVAASSEGRPGFIAAFFQEWELVHESRKPFKTATDAQVYARKVVERYQRLARVAMAQFVERQHVAS